MNTKIIYSLHFFFKLYGDAAIPNLSESGS